MTLVAHWLPELPAHWETVQMRRIAAFRNGADYKSVEVEAGGYPVYGSGGEFRRASAFLHDGVSVLFGRKGTIDKPLLVSGRFWTVDTMFFTVLEPTIDPRFLHYYATTMPFNYYSTSTAVPSMTQGDLAGHRLPLPPLIEQRAIADYLDRETARIDNLIGEQQRLIELLRERRRAVVFRAVARGLDESAALKDSGLPGAGPVPAHWEVLPLRHAISFQEGPGIMAADFQDQGVPLLRVSSVRTARATLEGCNYLDPNTVEQRWAHFRVDAGDLLISASASMGTVSEVTEEVAGAVPYTGIIRIKPGRMLKDFIRWFVVSGEFIDQVDSLKTGSTIQHFGPTHLAQMRVALPPDDEQRQIAAYLDEQTAKIDALIAEAERFIELSRERRSALVTAAVTGHIDVRGVA